RRGDRAARPHHLGELRMVRIRPRLPRGACPVRGAQGGRPGGRDPPAPRGSGVTAPLADAAQRARLHTEFETTFFVEAGAGTGKTTEVVARTVGLVAAGRVRARELVAITFTEAAAGELRARIREGLEDAARDRA